MIAYDLQCAQGHAFEGWFDDEKAFRQQQENGLVTCPVCNDATVERIPSTFAIRASSPAAGPRNVQVLEDMQRRMAAFVREHFDDVGSDFAKEALKIHYGVAEARNIRGVSTIQEEALLREEGVRFLKVPIPAKTESDA
mgnify:CR=1 FL=1|jgi:hypothetical protein